MGTVKIVLRKKMNQDGSFPLSIRITKDRKSSFIYVGQNIREKDWDPILQRVKKSHPTSQRLNNFLLKKISETNNKLLELEVERGNVSSVTVKQQLKPMTGGTSFFSQATVYLNNFKTAGKYNRLGPEQSRIKKFREFLKDEDISFQDITVSLLNRFKAYLKGSDNASERSIVNQLILIRTIFNQAIEANIVDRKYYPFGKNKISIRIPNSLKVGLTTDEVKQLEEIKIVHPYQNHTRNLWLFSFYFAGMRISDVLRLRWSDLQSDRLYYSMGKNAKAGSLKIPEKAFKILAQYEKERKSKNDLIFPELKIIKDFNDTYEVQRKISFAVKRIDEALYLVAQQAGFDKKLTMHIARHTFGNISGNKIPIQMLQKLYRHSAITTTVGYQSNFIFQDADDALDAVVGF